MNFLVAIILTVSQFISFYTLSFKSNTGNTIPFSNYQGKKVLLVNIATQSPNANQIAELESLYQQYSDSLIIVAFPSNDFGNESGTNESIATSLEANYHIHFILAEKTNVSGTGKSELYQWLSDQSLNGMLNSEVKKDFYKYLINSEGRLIGIFSDEVSPLSNTLQSAIIN